MKTFNGPLSAARTKRIKAQGYQSYTNTEIAELAFGNRFAYIVCTSFLIPGILTANLTLLMSMAMVAFLSVILPHHLFDYLYNYGVRKILDKPQLPPRSQQLKFACAIASIWIIATSTLFLFDFYGAAYVLGAALAAIAVTVSTTDFCLPSLIYNALFKTNSTQKVAS